MIDTEAEESPVAKAKTEPKSVAVKPKVRRRKRRRLSTREDEINVVVPERFAAIVGALTGVPLLKALYFLSEGERIGREGSHVEVLLDQIRAGIVALLEAERSRQQQEPTGDHTVPFRPVVHSQRPPAKAVGAKDAKEPPGLTAKDAQMVQRYCLDVAGGNEAIANAVYARLMEDAEKAGQLNSRWQAIAEDKIKEMQALAGERAGLPMPEDDPLFGGAADMTVPTFDDGR